MPIYEYYCTECDAEFDMVRPPSRADETAPCKTCGQPAERQLTTFSFKSKTFTAPKLGRPQKPRRPRDRQESGEQERPTGDSPSP